MPAFHRLAVPPILSSHRASARALIAFLAFYFAWSSAAAAFARATEDPRWRILLQALDDREKQMNPVWVKYKVQVYESAKLFEPVPPERRPPEQRYAVEAEFARKGEKEMTKYRIVESGTGQKSDEPVVITYNGKLFAKAGTPPDTYVVSRKREEITPFLRGPWGIMGDDGFRKALRELLGGKLQLELASWSELTAENGEPLLTMETVYRETGVRTKSWRLPGSGYMCSRYQMIDDRSNNLRMEATAEAFETLDGFKYPKRGSRTSYQNGQVDSQASFEITSLCLRPSEIPDSLFDPSIPRGAALYDSDLKVFIRDSRLAQSHLDEVVKLVGRSEGSTAWPRAVVVAAVAAIVVGTVLAWRRWRRSRAKAAG
jgi:hypothetical protein